MNELKAIQRNSKAVAPKVVSKEEIQHQLAQLEKARVKDGLNYDRNNLSEEQIDKLITDNYDLSFLEDQEDSSIIRLPSGLSDHSDPHRTGFSSQDFRASKAPRKSIILGLQLKQQAEAIRRKKEFAKQQKLKLKPLIDRDNQQPQLSLLHRQALAQRTRNYNNSTAQMAIPQVILEKSEHQSSERMSRVSTLQEPFTPYCDQPSSYCSRNSRGFSVFRILPNKNMIWRPPPSVKASSIYNSSTTSRCSFSEPETVTLSIDHHFPPVPDGAQGSAYPPCLNESGQTEATRRDKLGEQSPAPQNQSSDIEVPLPLNPQDDAVKVMETNLRPGPTVASATESERDQEASKERRKTLRKMIFDLNKLNYQQRKTTSETKRTVKSFQDHCSKFNRYIDFKLGNPYSEKDLEFEASPTPKARKPSPLPEVDAYDFQTKTDLIKQKHFVSAKKGHVSFTSREAASSSSHSARKSDFLPVIKTQKELIEKQIHIRTVSRPQHHQHQQQPEQRVSPLPKTELLSKTKSQMILLQSPELSEPTTGLTSFRQDSKVLLTVSKKKTLLPSRLDGLQFRMNQPSHPSTKSKEEKSQKVKSPSPKIQEAKILDASIDHYESSEEEPIDFKTPPLKVLMKGEEDRKFLNKYEREKFLHSKKLEHRRQLIEKQAEKRDQRLTRRVKQKLRSIEKYFEQRDLDAQMDRELIMRYHHPKTGQPLKIQPADLNSLWTPKELKHMRRNCIRKLSRNGKIYDDEVREPQFWTNPDNHFNGFQSLEDTMQELKQDYKEDSKDGGPAFLTLTKINKEKKLKFEVNDGGKLKGITISRDQDLS